MNTIHATTSQDYVVQKGSEMAEQRLALTLDGITAGDYLQWVRDPEPPALGQALRSIEVGGDPLGQTVEAVLSWKGSPPSAVDAAPFAGLPLIPEVTAVRSLATGDETSIQMNGRRRSRPAVEASLV
jgi:hypothetical protein